MVDQIKFELHPDKTKIVHFSEESTKFLGIKVGPISSSRPVVLYSTGERRPVTPRLHMTCDLPALYRKLKERGFVKFSRGLNKYVGIPYGRMQNLSVGEIIRYFNSVFRGI